MSEILLEYLKDRKLNCEILPLTPDASTRGYYRLVGDAGTSVACVYPEPFPSAELHPYIDVTRLFVTGGIRVPSIIDVDPMRGVIRMEDVGDTILRDVLQIADESEKKDFLTRAISIITDIQSTTESAKETKSIASRLRFDFEKLNWEMEFFTEHYFGSFRGNRGILKSEAREDLKTISLKLAERATVVTHRDFHAANIMVDQKGDLVVIDHQDARIGSTSYDLVSLLLDRIETVPPKDEIEKWIELFLEIRRDRLQSSVSIDEFASEFRLQSIQRCLKAIGTFSYQTSVRGKSGYTQYIAPMLEVALIAADELGDFPSLACVLKEELTFQTR